MAKVSVIMGVYNCKNKKLLRKSIQSIIDQTYADWEFLICDDGSTDDTLEVLTKFEGKDSRIRIIGYEQNKGLAYALNQCIACSNGEYIARQDDDDASEVIRFARQVDFLDKHQEYAIVGCTAKVYDESGSWGEYKLEEKPVIKTFLWNSPFAHPTVMMRKNALVSSGCYRVAKETRRCEDYDLFMRMYSLGYYGYNLQEHLYRYRIVNNVHKKYRPMKYRIDEAIVRYKGFKNLQILHGKGILYVFKPIFVGLIPQPILYHIKKNSY